MEFEDSKHIQNSKPCLPWGRALVHTGWITVAPLYYFVVPKIAHIPSGNSSYRNRKYCNFSQGAFVFSFVCIFPGYKCSLNYAICITICIHYLGIHIAIKLSQMGISNQLFVYHLYYHLYFQYSVIIPFDGRMLEYSMIQPLDC